MEARSGRPAIPEGDPHDPAVRWFGGHEAISFNELLGRSVFGPDGDEIGTVGDLFVELSRRSATYALVDVGGFLGIDAKPVLVPLTDAELREGRLYLPVDREALESAPTFDEESRRQIF